MENILNQTSTNSNSNFMDHLYCHPNETSKNYVHNHNSTITTTVATAAATTTNISGLNENNNNNNNNSNVTNNINDNSTNEDMLQEEVNSLKSMLLFHFDLIQTQAEQLQAKEIELKAQRAECEKLRARNTQLNGQVNEIQQQLEEQMKRNVVIKRSSLPPPPLAKIQCLNENVNKGFLTTTTTTNTATSTITTTTTTATSIPTIANTTLADKTRMPKLATVVVNVKKLVNSELEKPANSNTTNTTIVKNMPPMQTMTTPPPLVVKEDKSQTINAKLKTNTINNLKEKKTTMNQVEQPKEQVLEKDREYSNETTETSVDLKTNRLSKMNEVKEEISINNMKRSSSTLSIKAATTASSETTNCLSSIRSSTSCSSPASSTTLQRLSKRRRVWQVPELASDDSVNSFDSSMLDIESHSANQEDTGSGSCDSSVDCCEREDCSGCSESGSSLTSATAHSDQTLKEPQYLYYTANSPYMSRPWQEEELDGDLEHDIAEALRAAEPKLEIPKWTEHEIAPLYNIEGTEDLSDELFAKRHAKLELDEKRRKKWDVQQIREQRRLEKLRKRHCKDELNQGPVIQSFFPLNEDLEKICFVDTLPVQAFGEPIPMLPHNGEGFLLPWLLETDGRPLPPPKKATEFYRFGLKKMTRKEEKLWEEYLDEVEDASQDIENNVIKTKEESIENAEEEEKATTKVEKSADNKRNVTKVKEEEEEDGGEVKVNSICDNKNVTEENRNLRIADCCYASPTVMLARDCRPCASRTQQRRRLRYSTYIYLTKRRRQLSMSATAVKTTISNNNINTTTTNTTSSVASATKLTSSISISNLSKITTTTPTLATSTYTTTATTSKTYCKNIIKKNSLPTINNKLSTTTTVKNSTSKSKLKELEKIATTTTTTTRACNTNINNTHNNSNAIAAASTTSTTNASSCLDKTKENTTTVKSNAANNNTINEKSDKTELEGIISTTTTVTTTTTTTTNSIKSKLRNLRSSSSPCSYLSSSNSNSSTILDNTTPTSTQVQTPPTTSLSNITTTQTLVTTTKTK